MNTLEDLYHCVKGLNLGRQFGYMAGQTRGIWIEGDIAIYVVPAKHWIYVCGMPAGNFTTIFDVQEFLINHFDI